MTTEIQHGYLLLADISGYTSYLAGAELDHAHEILTDLLETILDRIKAFMNIAKLEGDAVFAYAPNAQIPRGEAMLELVESTYMAFRDRQAAIQRRTTCTCNACRNIPSLDLKFIVHHGEYLLQTVRAIVEPIGSDVNLAHRLMKNRVEEKTGWRAYALYTGQALQQIGIVPAGAHLQVESYEHLGDVTANCVNLRARHEEIARTRRVVLTPEEAHYMCEYNFSAPPEVVWEWFNDPSKRGQWMHSEIRPIMRIAGRLAPGARNHCVHGNNEVIIEDVLDIKPYEYYTVEHTPRGIPSHLRMSFSFLPAPGGSTHFRLTFYSIIKGLPNWARRKFCAYIVKKLILSQWDFGRIERLITEDKPT